MYTPNEIMFPPSVIKDLQNMRGEMWQDLVNRVLQQPDTHEDKLAFVLMMIRLDGCLECETDSYRAMRGCDLCAIQTLRRYKGPDSDLINLFNQALADIQQYKKFHVRRFTNTEFIPIVE